MKCDVCGKEFESGNRPDGIPNGMAFILEGGKSITMCAECIIEKGREVAEEKKHGNKN